MLQGYAIELFFDPALENQVMKAWNVFAQRQISTQLIKIESRPHLTLFVSPFIDIPKLDHALCDAMKKEGIQIGETDSPDMWIPYCVVAEEVPKNRIAEAFSVLHD